MKKKMLSLILSATMLSTMLVQPALVGASDQEEFAAEVITSDESVLYDDAAEVEEEISESDFAVADDEAFTEAVVETEDETVETEIFEFGEEDGFFGESETLEADPSILTEIEVYNIFEPTPDASPTKSIAYADSSKYGMTGTRFRWYDRGDDETPGKWMSDTDKFVQGRDYILYVYLKAETGYKFPENKNTITGWINGRKANCQPSSVTGADMEMYVEYHCSTILSKVSVLDVETPVALESPDFDSPKCLNESENWEYYIDDQYQILEGSVNGIQWYDEEKGTVLTEEDAFEAGKIYRFSTRIVASEGYEFAEEKNLTAKINGETASVHVIADDSLIVTTYFTCDKAAPDLVFEHSTATKKVGDLSFKIGFIAKETDGDIQYKSSDDSVATVDVASGSIRVLKAGTCVISATSAETDTYHEGHTTCILTVVPLPTCATPAKPTVVTTTTGVKITWPAVANAEKYRVFRTSAGKGWEVVEDTATTTCVDTEVVSGVAYRYTIRCINNDLTTYMSGYDKNGTSITYVATPQLVSASNQEKGVKVTWKAVAGAGKYRVFYKENGTAKWIAAGDTTATSLVVANVVKGKTYDFTVRAMNATGNLYVSAYDPVGKTVLYNPLVIIPDDVVLVSATASTTGVTIKWKQAESATKYAVFRRTTTQSGWTRVGITTAPTAVTYTDTTAAKGVKYYYTVVSYSNTGHSVGYQKPGLAAMIKLATPKLTSIANGSKGIDLKWNAISGAALYRVMHKNSSGGWSIVADVTGTSYTATGYASGSSHTFVVRCLSADKTYYTSDCDLTGKTITYLSAPVTTVSKDSNGIRVSWTLTAGASGYYIYRRTATQSTWTSLATAKLGTIDTLVDKTAQANVKYYYMVRAYKGTILSSFNQSAQIMR